MNPVKDSKLANFIRFGLYLTAFVPLIIFKDFISPFNFGKIVVFRSMIEILGACYLILILRDRSYLPRTDKIFWAFLIYTGVYALTTFTSIISYVSFWSTLEREGGLWNHLHYFVYFLMLISIFNKKEHWLNLLDLMLVAGVLSALYGFGQKTDFKLFIGSGNRARIFGTIGNAATFAGYELFFPFISLLLFMVKGDTQNRKALYLFAFVLTSIATLLTAVRGAVLGYSVGMAVFAYLWFRHNNSETGKKIFRGLIGAMILFIIFSLLFSGSSFVKESPYLSRITSLSLKSPTVQTRFWAWQSGLKGWPVSPKRVLLGWGAENYNIPFSHYFNPAIYLGVGSETLFDKAHNTFVEALVTMGIIGLIAYICMFVSIFSGLKNLLKRGEKSLYAVAILPAMVAYIIHNFFFFDAISNFILFFAISAFVSFNLADGGGEIRPSAKSFASVTAINFVTITCMIAVPVLIYKTNIVPSVVNYTTTRALIKTFQHDFSGAFDNFKVALAYDVPGKYEYRHRLAQYLMAPGGPSVKEANVHEAYTLALDGISKNVAENPDDYLPYLYGSRLNILLSGNDPKSPYLDKALEYSMGALKISPTFIRTYYEIGQAYLIKLNYSKAIEYFQKAVDLNPNTGESYWYLGSAKIKNGDASGTKDFDKALNAENPFIPQESEYLGLVDTYLSQKNYAGIADTFERLLVKHSDNPQYYASLAAAYVQLGKLDDAEKATRKAVELDPSFEPDARIFLKSIGRKL